MTWKQARLHAITIVRRWGLPRRLDDITIQLTEYNDNDTLRFFKADDPEITLQAQQLINQAFAREVRKRGAVVRFVPVDINAAFAWLARYDLSNTPANRAQYIAWLTAPEPKPTPIKP